MSENGKSENLGPCDSKLPADDLSRLRHLLFGDEQAQLVRIQDRLDSQQLSADDVVAVLAEAIRNTPRKQLEQALEPVIASALHSSIKKEPRPLADAMSPVMGPAIRRSIMQTIRAMMQSLNRTLEHSLSWRGIKWRLEAARTGKTFGEVVLLETLVYQVEHVFLIHRETSLLLGHVGVETAEVQDTDLVSSMLTAIQDAIQDFVHDSFGTRDKLQSLDLNERTVWIEDGPLAVLAVVIRGVAREDIRPLIQETLESIHIQYKEPLENFTGDITRFNAARDDLQACLQGQYADGPSKSPTKALMAVGLVAVVLLAALGYWGWGRYRWSGYVARLQREPGIVVTCAEKRAGKYYIAGLRDPLASAPESFLASARLDPQDVVQDWEVYHSSASNLLSQRLRQVLEPPATASLKVVDGVLRISGEVPSDWISEAMRRALLMPGVESVDTSQLRDQNPAWSQLVDALNAEPGMIVTSTEHRGGQFRVTGLRDPHARDPQEIIRQCGVDSSRIVVDWVIFPSPEPQFALRRAQSVLQPPEGVSLSVADGVLRISGSASEAWLRRAVEMGASIAGVNQVDFSEADNADQPWNEFLASLKIEPGIVVTEAGKKSDKYYVMGLPDPLARRIDEILADAALDPSQVTTRWEPYHSFDTRLVDMRLKNALSPPPEVDIKLDDQQTLHIAGQAGHSWIAQSLPAARAVPGVTRVDTSRLVDIDIQRVASLSRTIQQHHVYFAGGSASLVDADRDLATLGKEIRQLLVAARAAGHNVHIRVIGHTATGGPGESLWQLSQARANAVRAAPVSRGVPADRLTAVAVATTQPASAGRSQRDIAANRRVTLEVVNERRL